MFFYQKNRTRTIRLSLLVVLVASATGCSITRVNIKTGYHPPIPEQPIFHQLSDNIRVALAKNCQQPIITSEKSIDIYAMPEGKFIESVKTDADTIWKFEHDVFIVNGNTYSSQELRLVPQSGASLHFNGRHYRGQLTLIGLEPSNVLVINILPLEDYLKGVVPNEVLAKWPMEVLKAQAVTARTFAVYKMSGRGLSSYDLDASVNSQVYCGINSERESTNQAVEATKDLIISYQQKVIAAFYHSNCGGHTANSSNVWGSQIDYLRGRKCSFCETGPHFKWNYTLDKKKLEKILTMHNYPVKNIKKVYLSGREASNRVDSLEIKCSEGDVKIRSSAFRMAVGPDKIRSTNFYIEQNDQEIHFYGRGWGHGVGLCQEGAMEMANSGHDYQEIISFYYPNTTIVRLSTKND